VGSFRTLALGGVCLALFAGSATAQSAPPTLGAILDPQRGVLSFQPQIGASLSSVVRVVTLAQGSNGQTQVTGNGSGVIYDAAQGLILTNNHVVKDSTGYRIEFLNGRSAQATLVGTDPDTDVAVLKVSTAGLRAIEVADSDQILVGDLSFAVGYPLGLDQTVTMGIVSGLGRSSGEGIEDYIQTDAPINSGNSGGPLLDSRGRLIGLNTSILSRNGGNVGIGFVVPTRIAMAVAGQIQKYGKVKRGALGVSAGRPTQEQADAAGLPEPRGAVLGSVDAGSAAARGGLRVGDIIVAANGRPVVSDSGLRAAIGVTEAGSKVRLDYVRGRQRASTDVILADAATQVAAAASPTPAQGQSRSVGMSLRDLAKGDPYPAEAKGAIIDEVIDGSPAGQKGLQRGDLLVAVGGQAVSSAAEAKRAIESTSGPLRLVIARGNSLVPVVIGS
jgi:serine protease DegQ